MNVKSPTAVENASTVNSIDWQKVYDDLDESGFALLDQLIPHEECETLTSLYPREHHFRSHIQMKRHGFGQGEYKYFSYPLPSKIARLRKSIYPHLVPLANKWHECMKIDIRFPKTHESFIRRCHDAGQCRPTPLLLKYGAQDFNCLHQDLYGEHVFPLQVVILLSNPTKDFTGGEFVLTEQRPRMQSRVEVVPLKKGSAAIFAVHHRPVRGTKGFYRVNMRHGVSRVRSGNRYTTGIIFHDAK